MERAVFCIIPGYLSGSILFARVGEGLFHRKGATTRRQGRTRPVDGGRPDFRCLHKALIDGPAVFGYDNDRSLSAGERRSPI